MNLARSISDSAWARLAPQFQRKSMGLPTPGVQLRLPLYLLLVTIGFATLFALQSYVAFGRLYAMTISVAPASFEELIHEQLGDFAIVTLVISVAYFAVMFAVSVAFLHRLTGPTVAFRRHVRNLRRGNYASRVVLRKSEVLFTEFSSELNDLAGTLERRERAWDLAPAQRTDRNEEKAWSRFT